MRVSLQFLVYSCQFRRRLAPAPCLQATAGASCAPFLIALAIVFWLFPCPEPACAQNLDKTVMNVDEEVTAFAYAPDGRIVFSVRRMYKAKKYDLQRDDIFILESNGKRRRIFTGEKFTHGDKPFTYQVESFNWSPNGHIIAVELFTTTVDLDEGRGEDARALLLLDDGGHELHRVTSGPHLKNHSIASGLTSHDLGQRYVNSRGNATSQRIKSGIPGHSDDFI